MRYLLIAFALVSVGLQGSHPNQQSDFQGADLRVIKAMPAIYPTIAAIAEASGTVIVEVKIGHDGRVLEAKALEDHKLFRVAAENGAKLWTFNSVSSTDPPRTARLKFIFKFVPKKKASPEELLPRFLPPLAVEIRVTKPDYVFNKSVAIPRMKEGANLN